MIPDNENGCHFLSLSDVLTPLVMYSVLKDSHAYTQTRNLFDKITGTPIHIIQCQPHQTSQPINIPPSRSVRLGLKASYMASMVARVVNCSFLFPSLLTCKNASTP